MKLLFDPEKILLAKKQLKKARFQLKKPRTTTGLYTARPFIETPQIVKYFKTINKKNYRSFSNDYNYHLSWIRDTIKISHYHLLQKDAPALLLLTHNLFDYLHNNHELMQKVINKKGKLNHKTDTLCPRLSPLTLEPVPADHYKSLQLDMADILKLLANTQTLRLNVFRNNKDAQIVQLFINFLIRWDYSMTGKIKGDFGIWEEGTGKNKAQPEIHTSTIATMLLAFQEINNLRINSTLFKIPRTHLARGKKLLSEHLKKYGESKTRYADLTLLIILYEHLTAKHPLLTKTQEKLILTRAKLLERERGLTRYLAQKRNKLIETDDYNMKKEHAAEWPLGYCYLALIYYHKKEFREAQRCLDRLEHLCFSENALPEAYYGKTPETTPVKSLTWANALYLSLALKSGYK